MNRKLSACGLFTKKTTIIWIYLGKITINLRTAEASTEFRNG